MKYMLIVLYRNPLHLNIGIQILHTFFYTFPLVLIRRIFFLPSTLLRLVIIFFLMIIVNVSALLL